MASCAPPCSGSPSATTSSGCQSDVVTTDPNHGSSRSFAHGRLSRVATPFSPEPLPRQQGGGQSCREDGHSGRQCSAGRPAEGPKVGVQVFKGSGFRVQGLGFKVTVQRFGELGFRGSGLQGFRGSGVQGPTSIPPLSGRIGFAQRRVGLIVFA